MDVSTFRPACRFRPPTGQKRLYRRQSLRMPSPRPRPSRLTRRLKKSQLPKPADKPDAKPEPAKPATAKVEEKKPLPVPCLDRNLEAAVRKQVFSKRENTPPLRRRCGRLASVQAKGMKITDLSGLEQCKALAQLELPDNQIKDVSAMLAAVLQYVDLVVGEIDVLQPLQVLERGDILDLVVRQFELGQRLALFEAAEVGDLHALALHERDILHVGGIERARCSRAWRTPACARRLRGSCP